MGRASVDIIKANAFKVSALEVEGALLEHPAVQEAAVLGVPDDVHGEVVAALVVLKEGAGSGDASIGGTGGDGRGGSGSGGADEVAAALRAFCAERLPKYKVPSRWRLLAAPLPRNAMGKVNKKELLAAFFAP